MIRINQFIKLKFSAIGGLILLICALTSCQSKMDSCIESYVDEGYDYSDAVSRCEDARDDSIQHY